jgi:hypothetical protein
LDQSADADVQENLEALPGPAAATNELPASPRRRTSASPRVPPAPKHAPTMVRPIAKRAYEE